MASSLSPATHLTVPNKLLDIFPHGGPVVQAIYEFNGLGASLVSGCWCLVMILDDPKLEGVKIQNVQFSSIPKSVAIAGAVTNRD